MNHFYSAREKSLVQSMTALTSIGKEGLLIILRIYQVYRIPKRWLSWPLKKADNFIHFLKKLTAVAALGHNK